MKIIGGPSSQALATRVAREMNIEPTLCEFNRFPDGEVYTRIMEEPMDEVTIIQSTATDSDLMACLLYTSHPEFPWTWKDAQADPEYHVQKEDTKKMLLRGLKDLCSF